MSVVLPKGAESLPLATPAPKRSEASMSVGALSIISVPSEKATAPRV